MAPLYPNRLARRRRFNGLAIVCVGAWLIGANPACGREPVRLASSAVAAPDRYGAAAAAEVLAAGGNAVDATVAAAFALAVTFPGAGNLGGGGFLTLVQDGRPYFLDFRERAPMRASRDMYLDAHGEVIADSSLVGFRSVAVPGTVRGLADAHRRFARLPWARDLAPALRLARDGFIVDAALAADAAGKSRELGGRTNFDRYFGHLRAGQRFRQPELAAVLARIASHGEEGFYSGATADLLIAAMRAEGGLVSRSDLATYRAVWREPLVAHWREFDVVTAPPPSSGGIALIQLLLMKDALGSVFSGIAHNSVQYVHLLAEIEKRVFADRAEYLGDPDFTTVPVARLTDRAYNAARAAEVDPARPSATASVAPGLKESHQTTHFSIVDRDGNAAAVTYTLNDDFGSGSVVAGAGFLLNDEMDDFSVKPGEPNLFGVVGGDANAIAPGKRPLSSMTPTILMRDGAVRFVVGTPGGSRIFTSVFQVICNVYDFGMPLPAALASARVHHQLLPADTLFEEPFAPLAPGLREGLEARGYRIENQGWNGDIEAILVDGRRPVPASDPRGTGVSRTAP
jgi:gamma-glutamyltranspeptidase / glutathione hydrolase